MTSTINEESNPAAFAFWLRFWRRVIAGLEVVGGLVGLYVVAFGRLIGTSRVILLLAFVLYIASVWGGILLALNKRVGVAISLVIQILQIFQVSLPGFLYAFVCGLQILLGFYQTDVGPNFDLTFFFPARFFLFLNPPPGVGPSAAFIGLNVAAVLSIICLLYVRAAERHPQIAPKLVTRVESPEPEGVWPPEPKP